MLKLIDINFFELSIEEETEVEVCYFELNKDIEMSDGVIFKSGTKLIQLTKLDKDFQFFAESPDHGPSYFWANNSDVIFKFKSVEVWTPDFFRVKKRLLINDFL